MSELKNFQKFTADLAISTGKNLLKIYNEFSRASSTLKSEFEIVTPADLASEQNILREITKNFPTHGILSEETGARDSEAEYLWIVDPIDGTTNFSMRDPLWSISIALAHEGVTQLGVVYLPVLDELFSASLEEPARLNGREIHVSDFRPSDDPTLGGRSPIIHTFCHGSQLKDINRAVKYYTYQKNHSFECRQLGSSAVEMAYTACGRVDSIAIAGAHSWDVAAGELIVRQAGGKVTDFKGKDWRFENPDILATNGKFHVDLLKITSSL